MQVHGEVPIAAGELANVRQQRLVRASHEFEAQMMKELLKPMTAGDGLKGDEDQGGSGGVLGEFATEALGRSLSDLGGLGIANSILHSLSHSGNSSQGASGLGNISQKAERRSQK